MSEFNRIKDLRFQLKRLHKGLLTAYYPDGLDVLVNGIDVAQSLSKSVGELVQLAFYSEKFGNIYHLIYFDPEEQVLRPTPAFSLTVRNVLDDTYGRFLTKDEYKIERVFSGAPNVEPVLILDAPFLLEHDDIQARLDKLHNKTGKPVISEVNDVIFHSGLKGIVNGPIRPEELRHEMFAISRFEGVDLKKLTFRGPVLAHT